MPENELTRMMEYVRQRNRESGTRLGQTDPEDMTDDEGFSPNAPAPALVTASGKDTEVTLANPKVQLEEYQLTKYPPKIHAVDLDSMTVAGSHGKFPLDEAEAKQVIAICIRAMQRSFESILQTLVEQAGLAAAPDQESTNASTKPELVGNSAKRTRTGSKGSTGQ